VIALGGAFIALALGAIGGAALLLRAGVDHSAASWLVRALLGLALLAEAVVHPALAITIAALVVALTWRGPTSERAPWITSAGIAALLVAGAAALSRSPVPVFWDESVWLAKARVACEGGAALMTQALDPQSTLVPRGYPVIAAVLEACFAMGHDDLASLVGGGTALVLCALALFVLLLGRAAETPFEERASLAVLAFTPFVWVHLRSVQLDLPIGLCTAALVLAIERAAANDRLGLPAAVTAALWLGMKDEGLAAALAVALVLGARHASPLARRAAWGAFGALAISVLVYRFRLHVAGSANDDHSFGDFTPRIVLDALRIGARDASDIETWGLAPAVALAACVAAAMRSASTRARRIAMVLALHALFLLVALVIGPEQVRDFAREGTLIDRLGLQLLPTAALLIPRAMAGAAAEAPRTDHTAPRPSPDSRTGSESDPAGSAPSPPSAAPEAP
jgi:hypothetical protein